VKVLEMVFKLLEVWIIDKVGINYLNAQRPGLESTMEPSLFSGFLSAIQSLSTEKLNGIKMKDSKIQIIPVKEPIPFFVVGRALIKEKDDQILRDLMKIRDNFLNNFGERLRKWDGDVSIFEDFAKSLSNQMK
jgi:hypothetical protein